MPADDMVFFVVGCCISVLGILLLVFKKRALKAARSGADMPLLSPTTDTTEAPESFNDLAIVADPTAALAQEINSEIASHNLVLPLPASMYSFDGSRRPSREGSAADGGISMKPSHYMPLGGSGDAGDGGGEYGSLRTGASTSKMRAGSKEGT